MSSVDDRIVNMQFNNKQFEAGVSQSQASLKNLETTLAGAGKTSGLDQMGAGVDGVASKFTALKVAGITAIATIAHSVVQSAGGFIKSITGINAVMDGFSEYELKLGSTQTIMANTGESLKTVNHELERLNKYSDKTIYSFSDMTKNIGLFTNAGIGLKDATNMIQGFSNEAAVSGTNAAQAAGAAYQLSQALSAGTIRLMDWKSLTNVGMGNANMREGLIELADAMGVFEGDAETAKLAGENFNASLERNWLSADVMSNFLQIKAGKLSQAQMENLGLTEKQIVKFREQAKIAENAATKVRTWTQLISTVKEQMGSGWAKSIELIIGDFNEATKLFTAINDTVGGVLGGMADARNKMLKEWADSGGRDMILNSFGRIFKTIGGILKAVGDAFREVFPPSSVNILLEISKGFDALTKNIVPTKDTLESIKGIFTGVFTVLHFGWSIIKGLGAAFLSFFKALTGGISGAGGGVIEMSGNIGELLTRFGKWLESTAQITTVMAGFGTVLGNTLRPFLTIVSSIASALVALVTGDITGFTSSLGNIKSAFGDFVSGVLNGLSQITAPFEGLSNKLSELKDKVDELRAGFSSMTEGAVGKALNGVRDASDSAKSSIDGMYESISKGASGASSAATTQLSAGAQRSADVWSRAGDTIAAAVGAIGAGFSKLGGLIDGIRSWIAQLFGDFDAMDWAAFGNAILSGGLLITLNKLGKGIGTLTGSLAQLKDSGLGAIDQLTGTLKTMQTGIKAKIILDIAIAVGILTASLVALSFIKPEKLAQGLGAIAILLKMLTNSIATLGTIGAESSLAGIGAAIFLLSAALINLSIAVAIFGNLEPETLFKGLGAIAITLKILVKQLLAMSAVSGPIIAASFAMNLMATALTILAGAVAIFGNMDLGTLGKGLGSIAIALWLMVPAMQALSATGANAMLGAAGMILMAQALLIMSAAVLAFGNMDVMTLAVGFAAIALAITLMTASLMILGAAGPATMAGGAALIMLAFALGMLVPIIIALGTVPWQIIGVGIGFVALALTVLITAGLFAGPAALGLLALSVIITALGAAMFLAGTGMMLFATGLALFVSVGVAAFAVIQVAIHAFLALLPTIATQMAASLVAFLQALAEASPRIQKSLNTILKNMIQLIRQNIPRVKALFIELVIAGAEAVLATAPTLIRAAFELMYMFLSELNDNIPRIVDVAADIVITFMQELGRQQPRIAQAGVRMIIDFINGTADAINNNASDMGKAGLNLAYALVNGMTGGLLGWGYEKIRSAAAQLADAIPDWMKKILGVASPSKVTTKIGEQVAEGLARGMTNGLKGVVAAAVMMANSIIAEGNRLVAQVQAKASQAQFDAYKLAAQADITQKRAAAARKAAEKFAKENPKAEKAIKEREKRAKALEKLAGKQQARADKAQKAADKAATRVENVRTFEEADNMGKGDIRSAQALQLSDQASRMLAKANKEAAEARRLSKTNKAAGEKMLKQAREDARKARQLAKDAQAKYAEAQDYYEAEVQERIKQLEEDAAYDAADTEGKMAILEARAQAKEAKAIAEREAAAAFLAQAKAVADTDAAAALRLVEQAEKATQAAQEAADEAKADRDQIQQLVGGGSGGSGSGSITPSRAALEDAAKSIDRYTESLQQATELAEATQQPLQFVQNNYSPEAISASDAYRQGKNLVALAEIKMG